MSGIGATYLGKAMAAIIGPDHSALMPSTLWGAWLDASGNRIADTGVPIRHSMFGIVGDHVENTATIDAGTLPAGAVAAFAITDAETNGEIIASGPFTSSLTVGEAVVFIPAGIALTLGGSAS